MWPCGVLAASGNTHTHHGVTCVRWSIRNSFLRFLAKIRPSVGVWHLFSEIRSAGRRRGDSLVRSREGQPRRISKIPRILWPSGFHGTIPFGLLGRNKSITVNITVNGSDYISCRLRFIAILLLYPFEYTLQDRTALKLYAKEGTVPKHYPLMV